MVSTDGGHRAPQFNREFYADQQATLDFAFNSVPTVATVAKQLVASYYGKPARYAYFAGCSTGGREGMEAVQRYPYLFDGVVTGSPAMRTGMAGLAGKWAGVAFNKIAPKDPATGQPTPGGAFSPSDRKLVVDKFLATCDTLDGVADGMVFNVNACRFDPAVLTCGDAKTDSCLTGAQVNALHAAFGGPKTPSGRALYSPFPYDTGIGVGKPGAFEQVGIPGFLLTTGDALGSSLPVSIDVEAEEAAATSDALQQLVDTYNWTNLSTFFGRGGKHLLYAGVSDPWFSALDFQQYYERVVKNNGGLEKAKQSSRFFLVPGMGHCAGGPGALDKFDMLTPLVAWVENGKAPDHIIATGPAFPGRSRPLCPWPTHTHYKRGPVEDASSFECRL